MIVMWQSSTKMRIGMKKSPAKSSHLRVRSKIKQNFVFETLRDQILSGKYAAGAKLPVQTELATTFQASTPTIQQAIHRLANEGFVVARPRIGTVVAPKLRHLHNLALVLPNDPIFDSYYSRFFTVLANSARYLQGEQDRPFGVFYDVNSHSDTEDRQRLMDLVNAHQLAGIIFGSAPYKLEGTPILEQTDIPRVAIMTKQVYPQVPAISYDMEAFLRRAFDHLQSRGRRRIAVLAPVEDQLQAALAAEVARRGLVCPPHWRLVLLPQSAVSACNCVRLLLQGPAGTRPDGLLILDDNLVEHTLAGVIAEQIRVPIDLEVVAHCNFPWPPNKMLPVTRLGFDSREVLRQCMHLIDRQRRGEPVPGLTHVAPVFEHELAPN